MSQEEHDSTREAVVNAFVELLCTDCLIDAGQNPEQWLAAARRLLASERLSGEELGWLIENRSDNQIRYARFTEYGCTWVKDSLEACRFARKEDAMQMAYGEDCSAVCEHLWSPRPLGEEAEPEVCGTCGGTKKVSCECAGGEVLNPSTQEPMTCPRCAREARIPCPDCAGEEKGELQG